MNISEQAGRVMEAHASHVFHKVKAQAQAILQNQAYCARFVMFVVINSFNRRGYDSNV